MRERIVTVRFTSHWPYHPGSLLVARLSGSKDWSHTMIIVDDLAYDATMNHGCRVRPVAAAMAGVARYRDMLVPVPDLDAAIAFGFAQDGKPYDWAGAFGIPFLASEDWGDDSRWWCSEHTFAMLMAGGTTLLDPDEAHRVRPSDLLRANHPKLPAVRLR